MPNTAPSSPSAPATLLPTRRPRHLPIATEPERKAMQTNEELGALEQRARRRVGIKMGFTIHALVFVVVNLGLYALNSSVGGQRWSHFPLWGWGLGLAIHGVVTLLSLQGDGLR